LREVIAISEVGGLHHRYYTAIAKRRWLPQRAARLHKFEEGDQDDPSVPDRLSGHVKL
jgi:hypothetical protein